MREEKKEKRRMPRESQALTMQIVRDDFCRTFFITQGSRIQDKPPHKENASNRRLSKRADEGREGGAGKW